MQKTLIRECVSKVLIIDILVLLSLSLVGIPTTNTALNEIPSLIDEAKAIKHKTPSALPQRTLTSSSPLPAQSNSASPGGCINYNPSTRTITVSCSSPARLSDIDNKLHDNSILAKQSPTGVWFLSANLEIAKGATFHIDSTDTKWLKISSKVTHVGIAKIAPAYIIDVHGSLKIDSVKITSWDPTTNYYACLLYTSPSPTRH